MVVFNSSVPRLCDAVVGVPMAENQPERNKIGLGIGGDQSEARQPFILNNAPDTYSTIWRRGIHLGFSGLLKRANDLS